MSLIEFGRTFPIELPGDGGTRLGYLSEIRTGVILPNSRLSVTVDVMKRPWKLVWELYRLLMLCPRRLN